MGRGNCACRYCTERVEIVCPMCLNKALVLRKKIEIRGQRFCSRKCAQTWNGRIKAGHPFCACGCGRPVGSQSKLGFIRGHNSTSANVPSPKFGPANWRWGGGPKRPHLSKEHRAWRELIFSRDDWRCRRCGQRSAAGTRLLLHAHHIVPIFVDPVRATDLENGVTLCVPCHRQTHRDLGLHPRKKRLSERPVTYRVERRSQRIMSTSRSFRTRAAATGTASEMQLRRNLER